MMIFNITLDVLPPDDWMVVLRFEKFGDIFGPSFDGVEPLLPEHTGQVSLDSSDGGRSEVVAKDPQR